MKSLYVLRLWSISAFMRSELWHAPSADQLPFTGLMSTYTLRNFGGHVLITPSFA